MRSRTERDHLTLFWGLLLSVYSICLLPANGEICGPSIDFRNDISEFKRLRTALWFEAHLQILLIGDKTNNLNQEVFRTLSFPKLTMVTDYLLLFRVSGLDSLSTLFHQPVRHPGAQPLLQLRPGDLRDDQPEGHRPLQPAQTSPEAPSGSRRTRSCATWTRSTGRSSWTQSSTTSSPGTSSRRSAGDVCPGIMEDKRHLHQDQLQWTTTAPVADLKPLSRKRTSVALLGPRTVKDRRAAGSMATGQTAGLRCPPWVPRCGAVEWLAPTCPVHFSLGAADSTHPARLGGDGRDTALPGPSSVRDIRMWENVLRGNRLRYPCFEDLCVSTAVNQQFAPHNTLAPPSRTQTEERTSGFLCYSVLL
ncbi:hypothetical protein SKAU_G00387980 [Synaphobranchus kaupii]|uniref:Uncharacterized protein n=1 Tax=Synaphobranchus kaupii TaxID=118154 RepID=A0A9Q1EB02_SYNKA|nr:hypothetical protein SKAU_G00387980 [Synaphobranchus kaupii]